MTEILFLILYFITISILSGYYLYQHERIFSHLLKTRKNKTLISLISISLTIFLPLTPILGFKYFIVDIFSSADIQKLDKAVYSNGLSIGLHVVSYLLGLFGAISFKRRKYSKKGHKITPASSKRR